MYMTVTVCARHVVGVKPTSAGSGSVVVVLSVQGGPRLGLLPPDSELTLADKFTHTTFAHEADQDQEPGGKVRRGLEVV